MNHLQSIHLAALKDAADRARQRFYEEKIKSQWVVKPEGLMFIAMSKDGRAEFTRTVAWMEFEFAIHAGMKLQMAETQVLRTRAEGEKN